MTRLLARLVAWLARPIGPDQYCEYIVRQIDPIAWERDR